MNEKVEKFGPSNNLIGIYTQPDVISIQRPIIVLINAGLVYRVGPNRLYTALARKLAEKEFSSFRFDLPGIGESKNDNSSNIPNDNFIKEATLAIDHLAQKYKVNKFILIGLCSGAEISFRLALDDQKIVGIIPINATLSDNEEVRKLYPYALERIKKRLYSKKLFNARKIVNFLLKIPKNKQKVFDIIKSLVAKNRPFISNHENGSACNYSIHANFKKLQCNGVKNLIIYSEGSTALDIFQIICKTENIEAIGEIKIFNNTDHVFTFVQAQNELMETIVDWICKYFYEVNYEVEFTEEIFI